MEDVEEADPPVAPVRAVGPVQVAVAGLVVAVFRLWVARHARLIDIYADEAGYLGIARFFGHGGVNWNLGTAGTYSLGYGMLLSPWYWLSHDPDVVYRGAVITNALLGAATVPLLYALTRRLTPLTPRSALLASVALLVAPAASGHANWAWSENLAAPAFYVIVLLAMRFAETPGARRGLALAAATPVAFLIHSRLLGVAVIVLGLFALAGLRRWVPRSRAAGCGAIVVLGLVAVRQVSAAVYARLWTGTKRIDQVTNSIGNLTKFSDIAASVLGQGWYVVATTAGLAGLGAIPLVRAALARPRDLERDVVAASVRRSDAVTLVALSVITIGTSVVFMAGRDRADHLVYGRYNDPIIVPLALMGIAVLALARSWSAIVRQAAALAGMTAAAAWYLRHTHAAQLESAFVSSTVLGLVAASGTARLRMYLVTAVGLAALAGLVALAGALRAAGIDRALGSLVVAGAVGILAVSAMVVTNPKLRQDPTIVGTPQAAASLRTILPDGASVRYKTYLRNGQTGVYEPVVPFGPFFRYQFYLPGIHFLRESPWERVRRTPWFFSIMNDVNARRTHARIAYVDPWWGVALWVEKGPEQDRLRREGKLLPEYFPIALPPDARQGTVRFLDPATVADGHLRTRIAVRSRSVSSPWPAYQWGFAPDGTVRVVLTVTGRRCACVVDTLLAQLPNQLPAGATAPPIAVDVPLTNPLPAGGATVTARLEQAAYGMFGPPTGPAPIGG